MLNLPLKEGKGRDGALKEEEEEEVETWVWEVDLGEKLIRSRSSLEGT